MKAILQYAARLSAMMNKLFRVITFRSLTIVSRTEEPTIAKETADKVMMENVLVMLKNYPDFEKKSLDIHLLRRKLKRYEHLRNVGSPAAAAALKQLAKQWRKVVRKIMIEKESAIKRIWNRRIKRYRLCPVHR